MLRPRQAHPTVIARCELGSKESCGRHAAFMSRGPATHAELHLFVGRAALLGRAIDGLPPVRHAKERDPNNKQCCRRASVTGRTMPDAAP